MQGIDGKYLALAAAVAILGAGFAAHAENQTNGAAAQNSASPQPGGAATPQGGTAPQPSGAATPQAGAAAQQAKPVSEKAFEAKFTYCKTCHGAEAQGFRGAFPIPRLAGQQPEYIKNQLQAFIEKRRLNPVMNNVVHVLSPDMVDKLAKGFYNLHPAPLGGAPEALVPAGKEIYQNGVPSAQVPPCASCHGDDAKGNGEFPRLAGQLNDYIVLKLTRFGIERGVKPNSPDTAAIMKPIAHNLTQQQIAEVAAYVSTLK